MKRLLIITLLGSLCTPGLLAQNTDVQLGIAQTTLGKNATQFAVDYAKKLTPKLELFRPGKNHLVSFSPELKILLGSNDVFNGVLAKYTGNIMSFKTTTISGVDDIPDLSKLYHNFPVSAGFESNQGFSFLNGLLEAGYVPWYQNITSLPKLIRQTKIGFFVQGGYKQSFDDSTLETGGAADESAEKLNSGIARLKASAGFSPHLYFEESENFGVALIGNGDFWYDMLNSSTYYRLEGKVRFLLKKDYHFDVGFEKGSGAPNFNTGEQFTANLGIRF